MLAFFLFVFVPPLLSLSACFFVFFFFFHFFLKIHTTTTERNAVCRYILEHTVILLIMATIQTTKRTARTARRITVLDGEATTLGRRRRNRKKKYSDIRCYNSRKVQSPGSSSAASKGCPGFAKAFGKMVKGMSPTRFFEKTIRRKGRLLNRVGG